MSKDKPPSHRSQLFPRCLKDLKQSPVWRQQQEAIAKLREGLPQPYPPEQVDQLRALLKTSPLPDVSLPPELVEVLREERNQQAEPEQAVESAAEPTIEQMAAVEPVGVQAVALTIEPTVAPTPVQAVEAEPEQAIDPAVERTPPQPPATPGRPRHRPRLEFPHLPEALMDLKKEPRFKNMQPKEKLAFVVKRLRHYGDKVENAKGEVMEKTISRRIHDWLKGRLTFAP